MNDNGILVILLEKDTNYQLLKRLIDEQPELEKVFKLKELLNIPTLSWNEKVHLRNIFMNYSEIFTPTIHFVFEENKWVAQRIRPQTHQVAIKILNLIRKEEGYVVSEDVSTSDFKLIGRLIENWNKLFRKACGEMDSGYRIDQEMLDFISNQIRTMVGEIAPLDYRFVRAFLETLSPYDQMMIKREFGR